MKDIVERLQIMTDARAAAPATTREAAEEIERLRADARQKTLDHITTIGESMEAQVEIKRLRALITEWADADDAAWGTESGRLENACEALRKAVGQ